MSKPNFDNNNFLAQWLDDRGGVYNLPESNVVEISICWGFDNHEQNWSVSNDNNDDERMRKI